MQHRYLCERCGGTGHQEAGCWSGKAYDSKEGTCESCGGTGYLGSKGYSHADIDEFSGCLFHGCQRLTMAEVAKRMNAMQKVCDRLDDEIKNISERKPETLGQVESFGTQLALLNKIKGQ